MQKLKFDEKNHVYKLAGVVIPSVTQVISSAGLSDFSRVDPDVLEKAQNWGKAVHSVCHLYDTDNLDSFDPLLQPSLDAWIKWKKDTGFVVESSEQIVYSRIYNYAGTYDRVGLLDGVRTLVDIKTGTTLPKTIALQTAGYMGAFNEGKRGAQEIRRRLCVQLLEGTYKMHEYKERTDFRVFTSCLNILNFKKINNINK